MKIILTYTLVALLGLADSIYLTYTRFLGITPPCGISIFSGCATVAKSQYSVIFGVPLSLLGVIFYASSLALAILLVYKNTKQLKTLLIVFSTLGALSSLYFIYLQAFIIRAFCIYCVFSALCSCLLFGLSLYIYKKYTK